MKENNKLYKETLNFQQQYFSSEFSIINFFFAHQNNFTHAFRFKSPYLAHGIWHLCSAKSRESCVGEKT